MNPYRFRVLNHRIVPLIPLPISRRECGSVTQGAEGSMTVLAFDVFFRWLEDFLCGVMRRVFSDIDSCPALIIGALQND